MKWRNRVDGGVCAALAAFIPFTVCASEVWHGQDAGQVIGVKQWALVEGFADVIQEKKKAVNPATSKRPESPAHLMAVLKTLNLREPKRRSGWKFGSYALARFRRILASRGGTFRGRVVMMVATAYCPRRCCGSRFGVTASGRQAEYGIAAVDPRIIPLGTALYVDGYGFAIAADVGSAIKGNRIDLCFPTHREATHFGRRSVRVLILR